MPKKFDQDTEDWVVRLVEDHILAENLSMQDGSRSWRQSWESHGIQPGNEPNRCIEKVLLPNTCLRISLLKTPGYVVRIRSCGRKTPQFRGDLLGSAQVQRQFHDAEK